MSCMWTPWVSPPRTTNNRTELLCSVLPLVIWAQHTYVRASLTKALQASVAERLSFSRLQSQGEPNVPREARPILHGKVEAPVQPRKISTRGRKNSTRRRRQIGGARPRAGSQGGRN